MAPDAWAQATSMSERACEEQPLFMMLEDILGDAYEPDASRMTARSARLTQITDDYAAAALARSQPDALPPPYSIPFQPVPIRPASAEAAPERACSPPVRHRRIAPSKLGQV